MGDLIDPCLPTLGNLILIFVPRVGIFEFSDQEEYLKPEVVTGKKSMF
jgi:hypothetical protein